MLFQLKIFFFFFIYQFFDQKLNFFFFCVCVYFGLSFFFKLNFFFFLFYYASSDKFFLISSKNVFANSLINGVLFIHPVMINLGYVVCFLVFFYFFKNQPKKLSFSAFFLFLKKISLIFTLIALFLGSFWAQQELNWGGFWSWDPVELASFFFFVFFIFFLHSKSTAFLSFYATKFFFIFFFFFFGLRFGYFSSVHTFVVINSQANQLNYYMLVCFFFLKFKSLKICTVFNFFFFLSFMFFIGYAIFTLWVPVVFNMFIHFFFIYVLKLFLIFFFAFLYYRLLELSFFFFLKKKIMHASVYLLVLIFLLKINYTFETSKIFFKNFNFFFSLKGAATQKLSLFFSFFFENDCFFYDKEYSFNAKNFKFSTSLTKNLTVRHNLVLNENFSLVLSSVKKNKFFFLINSFFFVFFLSLTLKNLKKIN